MAWWAATRTADVSSARPDADNASALHPQAALWLRSGFSPLPLTRLPPWKQCARRPVLFLRAGISRAQRPFTRTTPSFGRRRKVMTGSSTSKRPRPPMITAAFPTAETAVLAAAMPAPSGAVLPWIARRRGTCFGRGRPWHSSAARSTYMPDADSRGSRAQPAELR